MTSFEQQWRDRFERYGRRHHEEHSISGWSAYGLQRRVSVFEGLLDEGLLAPGARVLELGCGAGTYVRLLAKRGYRVVGLDYSLPSLGRARASDPGEPGRYLAGDAYALPFKAGCFDGVVCIGVLQALERPAAALGEIVRVLAPAGRLLVETLNPWSPPALARRTWRGLKREPSHLHYFAPGLVEGELAALGARRVRRLGLMLPPRSSPGLGKPLAHPRVARVIGGIPVLGQIAPHAFWIVGERR